MRFLVALALIAVIGAAASVVYYFGYFSPREHNSEVNAEIKANERERTLEASRCCKEDGAKFAADFTKEADQKDALWDTPEFHFSKKLNSCLVHVRYVMHVYKGLSDHYNELWDVYSNRVIFYGYFSRDTSVNPWREELLMPLGTQPNYTSHQYFEKKAQLFSE
jgi:hypothetical protein